MLELRERAVEAPHLLFTDEAAHVFLDVQVIAPCCGEPRVWFVNRDGRTLCAQCDEAKYLRPQKMLDEKLDSPW